MSVRIRARGWISRRFEITCSNCGRVGVTYTRPFAILIKHDHLTSHLN